MPASFPSASDRARHRLRATLIALSAVFVAPAALADRVDDFVRQQMELQRIPAAAVAVLKRGKPVKVRAYGIANLEQGTPATVDSVFQIGSVSKQFIASGVLLLVQDGRVSLEDSIARHIPESPDGWRAITVRHLLTHTSGLPRETQGLQTRAQSDVDTLKEAMAAPLLFPPGEQMAYSNVGYSALAEIITRSAGMPWPRFMQQRIFVPLGMHATRITGDEVLVPHRASGYVWNGSAYQHSPALPGLRPSGAFLSSLRDLVRWDAALRTDLLLQRPMREMMWTPVTLRDGSTRPYGFGWEIDTIAGHRVVAHAGTMLGFRASIARYPDDDVTVIVLANAFGSLPEKIGERLAALQIAGLHPQRRGIAARPAALDRFVGEYRAGNSVLVVARNAGLLTVTRSVGGRSMPVAALTPESDHAFFDAASPRATYAFEADAAGGLALVMRDDTGQETLRALRGAP